MILEQFLSFIIVVYATYATIQLENIPLVSTL